MQFSDMLCMTNCVMAPDLTYAPPWVDHSSKWLLSCGCYVAAWCLRLGVYSVGATPSEAFAESGRLVLSSDRECFPV